MINKTIYLDLINIPADDHIQLDHLHLDDRAPLANHPIRKQIQKFSRYHRRHMLACALNSEADKLVFSSADHGKPQLASHPQLSFNQSHTEQLYALVWSLGVPDLGVDIESLLREVRQPAMAQHTLTTWEMQQWERAGQPNDYWMKMWTIKEAVLKASGLGIRLNLNELDTQCLLEQQYGEVSHPQIGSWCYQCFVLSEHMLTVSWPSYVSEVLIDIKKPA